VIIGSVWHHKHQRDIPLSELSRALGEVKRPDLLQYIVDISRFYFGFYTSHYPRVFEYTWILENVLEVGEIKTAIDLGAGVCPIPIALSEEGIKVYTVDGHEKIRNTDTKSSWNEWGFLDYSYINSNLESHNLYFQDFNLNQKVDLVYSISVIEHMPAKVRRSILKKASMLLKIGGLLLLTIDLVPNTKKLWNLNEGKVVEDEKAHGTVTSFKKELKKYGFVVKSLEIQRGIDNARTDILYIKAIKNRSTNIFKSIFR
jgi:2-polyprenyl-3-methyl-5-hydroxy-6-metoxy-1,4-benzoquinol methylase